MSTELIGKTVNGYEILSRAGQGGMAMVYRARQRSMNRDVALKFLPSVFLNDEAYLQRFEREVKIVSQLEHRNIVPVYDFGKFEDQPYIAMRYMRAGSVEDLLAEGPAPLPRVLSIVRQVASALDYAHQQGILHRDLKPSNILLDDGGGAFITDFGIARILNEGSGTITTQGVVGTPSYMSPEQARAEPLDGRSDVYSLGVMLFELVTGVRPFQSETPYSIAVMHVTMPPPSPRQYAPTVSAPLEEVVMRALQKRRDERYQSAGELAEALRRALESADLDRPTAEAADPEPPGDRRPRAPLGPSTTAPGPGPIAAPASSTLSEPLPTANALPNARRPQENRRRQIWIGAAAGGAIGCLLLAGLLVLGLSLLGALSSDEPGAASPTPLESAPGVAEATVEERSTPTPTATEPATADPRQMTRVALNADADATFTAEAISAQTEPTATRPAIQPVGVRERAPLNPALAAVSGELVYFARRESSGDESLFEIVVLDLRSWQRRSFTIGESSSTYPMPSPDGRWIAFQSNHDGDFDIYVANRYGGQLRQLTRNTVWDRLPAWSPGGEWIVYSSDTRADQTLDISRVRALGREVQPVYSDGWRNSHARYSPDGQRIVFTAGASVHDASGWEIRLLDLGTGASALLTENNVRDASPAFSPDGQRIIYVTTISGARALASMNPAGGDRRILYTGPGSVWSANYSPDGKFLVLTATVSGVDQLFLMQADGGNAQRITTSGGAYASWIPPVAR